MVLRGEEDVVEDDVGGGAKDLSIEEAKMISKNFAEMLKTCREAQRWMDECEDDGDCAKASLALTMCVGKVMCPLQHQAVTQSLNAKDDDDDESKAYNARVDAALDNLTACVTNTSIRTADARKMHPNLF